MRKNKEEAIPNKQLKVARQALGYSPDEVAEATQTTEQTVRRWERGITIPQPVHMARLCKFLGKTAEELGYPETGVEKSTGQDLHQFPHGHELTQEQISAIEPTTEPPALPGDVQVTQKKSPVWSVPKRNAFFTEREDVLKEIRLLFQENTLTRPVAITGLGGMGKTQVAIEYAWRNRQNYGTVLWITADSLENLTTEFLHFANVLDLPEEDSPDLNRTIAAIKRWLEAQINWLLIIDNVETPEMLHPFLPEESAGHILLTTRAQATGNLAQTLPLRKMEPAEGALLLLRRAQILASKAALESASQADQDTARAVAQELDGLPLALDQAGAYIEETACSVSIYLARYRNQHELLLKRRSPRSYPYAASVATTWLLSFQKVREANRAAAELLYFCAFLGPAEIPLSLILYGAPHLSWPLRFVAADPARLARLDEAISILRRYSLVQHDPEHETLSIHRLVQTIVSDEMRNRTQRLWAKRTIKALNRAFICGGVYIPQAEACIDLIERWGLNSRVSADLLLQAGRHARWRLLYRRAEALLVKALEIYEKVFGSQSVHLIECLVEIALLYQAKEQFEQAESFHRRALDLSSRALGTKHPATAECLTHLAELYKLQAKHSEAEALYLQALDIYQVVLKPCDPSLIKSFSSLATYYCQQGRFADAEPLYQQALDISRRIYGTESLQVATINKNLADVYLCQGKCTEAESLIQQLLC